MKTLNLTSWTLTLIFVFTVVTVCGQQTYNPKALVPLNPAYKTGVLQNGIRYILRGDLSDKKAFIYAFYNIGSIQEEPNEFGIAHLLEHLCFYGKNNYIDYFKTKGMNMGDDINASTGIKSAEYKIFNVPVQNEGVLDTALLFLRELSFSFNLKPADIDKERKVVLEEWRLGRGVSDRMFTKIDALALKGSRYARPGIIGDTAVINNCKVSDVKHFFNKWYRPDNLTVVIIGGFDTGKMESKVKQFFGSVPKAEGKSPRIDYSIPDTKEPIINIVSDPEAFSSEIEIHYKHSRPVAYNQAQLRTEYVDRLINNMFQNRLDKITDRANSPFLKTLAEYSSNYFYSADYDEYFLNVTTNQDVKLALKTLLAENERVIQYGFTNDELQYVKKSLLKNYGPSQKEFKLPYTEYFIQCYYYVLKGKTQPSFTYNRNFVNSVLPLITLDEVNQRFIAYTSKIQPVISIACPLKGARAIPTVEEVKDILASIPSLKIEPYVNVPIAGKLFNKTVKSGVVTQQKVNTVLETTEWLLSNGMRIIIKPTNFSTDDIQFKGSKKNDTLKLKGRYMTTLVYGSRSIKKMGVDQFSGNELKQLLNGKHVYVEPELNVFNQGITGNTSIKDFETALQLIHLYYSNQRWDENTLTKEVQYYQALRVEKSFFDALHDTVSKYTSVNIRRRSESSNLNEVSLENLKKIHRYAFKDPASYTLFFTGNVKPEAVKPLIEKYLGSLQADKDSTHKAEIFDSTGFKKPSGEKKTWYETGRRSCEFLYPMQTPSALVYVCCQGKTKESRENALYGEMAQDLLINKCENTIRGKYGASYRVGLFISMVGSGFWQGHVYFQTDPKIVEEMKNITLDVMKSFMEGAIQEDEFNIWKNNAIKKRAEELRSNKWWVNTGLPEYYFSNNNVAAEYIGEIKNTTLEGLKTFTRSIYRQGNIIDIVMKSK